MQTVYVEKSNDEAFDILTYYDYQKEPDFNIYKVFPMLDRSVSFIITSIHNPVGRVSSFKPDPKKKPPVTVSVISYVPPFNSVEWSSFYINLCLAEIIACDSFVAKQLGTISYPPKRIILIDGISPLVNRKITDSLESENIPVYVHCHNAVFRERYQIQCEADMHTDKNSLGIRVVNNPLNALGIISFEPVGQALSNTLAANYRVWLPYDPLASINLDCRLTHNYMKQIARISEISGSAQTQMVQSLFRDITQNFCDVVMHSIVSNVEPFTTNQTLVYRIMNELNRAQ